MNSCISFRMKWQLYIATSPTRTRTFAKLNQRLGPSLKAELALVSGNPATQTLTYTPTVNDYFPMYLNPIVAKLQRQAYWINQGDMQLV
jgi:hypothetical protein